MAESELRRAIETSRSPGQLAEVLARFGNDGLTNAADAEAVARLVSDWSRLLRADDAGRRSLRAVLGFFQQVETQEAFETLAEHGLPHVRDLFDALRDQPSSPERSEDLLFAAKILVLYHDPQDLARIADAARDDTLDDEPLWSVIFQSIGEGYPLQTELLEALREPLPQRSAGIAYLDWINGIAAKGPLDHPFDTEIGRSLLRDWLGSTQPDALIASRSAAAALPYLDATSSSELIQTAQQHPGAEVRLLAAFAAAKSGDRSAIEELAKASLDVRYSATAVRHLESLGELNAIPVRAKNPDFMAAAEVCRWLSHPMEFGRPPDEVELRDRRTLFWPPANEARTLWLVRFRYKGAGPDGADEASIGLAGSITFALYGEVTWDTPPEDVYALHCCWELEVEQDPRAPAQRSIEAGRELLRNAGNPGFQ
jgi:hypothetical protein